jgi:L-alanine-DL-glutamate epimerase-like enolase superfamily enzyme
MRITKIEAIPVAIPFEHDGPPTGFGGTTWRKLNFLLVKVSTDEGLVGWGEAFGYNIIPATIAALEKNVAPLAIGRDPSDVVGLMDSLKKPLHIFGRSGPGHYAVSGLDIALWDLAGKRAGVPVATLLGGSQRDSVTAYTSLLKLSDPTIVASACERALGRGFRRIKLHEVTVEAVAAARQAIGPDVDLMLDVNCAWPASDAIAMARRLEPFGLKWLEEPVWPPEDLDGLVRIRAATSVPIAVGENVGNAWAFKAVAACPAVDYLQPSVTKVGGISEFTVVATQAELAGRKLAPHSPYFGPGILATLQLAARYPSLIGGIESFGVRLEASLFGEFGVPRADGTLAIPKGPGLGADPDPELLARYAV